MVSYIRTQMGRLARIALVLTACAFMLLNTALPAYAGVGSNTNNDANLGGSKSSLNAGEAKLNDIYERSEDALKAEPRPMNEIQKTAEGGLNEIQGAADYDQMNRPDNSQDATSVPDQIKRAFDKVTDR